jgi:hypothetical protein
MDLLFEGKSAIFKFATFICSPVMQQIFQLPLAVLRIDLLLADINAVEAT